MRKADADRLIHLLNQEGFDYEAFFLQSTMEYNQYLKQS